MVKIAFCLGAPPRSLSPEGVPFARKIKQEQSKTCNILNQELHLFSNE